MKFFILLIFTTFIYSNLSYAKHYTRLVKKNLKCARYLVDKSIDGQKSVDYAFDILNQTYSNGSDKRRLKEIKAQCNEYKKGAKRQAVSNSDLYQYFLNHIDQYSEHEKVSSLLENFIMPKLNCKGVSAHATIASGFGLNLGGVSLVCSGTNGRLYLAKGLDSEQGFGFTLGAAISYNQLNNLNRNDSASNLIVDYSVEGGLVIYLVLAGDDNNSHHKQKVQVQKVGLGVGAGVFISVNRNIFLKYIGIGNSKLRKIAKNFHE